MLGPELAQLCNQDYAPRMDKNDERTVERYRLHADLCKVLTDPKRLMLVTALRAGERSVGELALAIGVALPNASQHLAVLRAAGLVGPSTLHGGAPSGNIWSAYATNASCAVFHAQIGGRT